MPKRTAAGSDKNKKPYKRAKKAQKVKMMQPELKGYDIAAGNAEFQSTGRVELLNPVVQGTDNFNRVGRKINMKSVHVRGVIFPKDPTISIPRDHLRLLLVYDKQTNALLPSGNDVLMDSNAVAGTSSFSHVNLANRERFVILRDTLVNVPQYDATSLDSRNDFPNLDPALHIDWYVSLKGKDSIYNQLNNGNIGDIQTGALFLLCYNYIGASTDLWSCFYTSRLRYYDA